MKISYRVIIGSVLIFAQAAFAAPAMQTHGVFDVVFYNSGDSIGEYTSQSDWTAEQMTDVASAIDTWSERIGNTAGRQIQMHAIWSELDDYGTNVLGGSGSSRIADGTTQWNLGEYVWREGDDPGDMPSGIDTLIQYDITAAGVAWNFGSDAPAGGEIDFRSIVTHEIGHSLGFDSSYNYSFDDWGWFDETYEGLTAWDKNLIDALGNRPDSAGNGIPDDFDELGNPVYWEGVNAVNEYGELVPIYAPDPFEAGSSITHLDQKTFGDLIMSPAIGTGLLKRDISDLEWAMMEDMGWTVIPEPATLLVLGLGAILLRKRPA